MTGLQTARSGAAIGVAAARLETAAARRQPCPPVRDVLPAGDIGAAYAVQSALIAARTAVGARAVGRKIGLTNPKVQAQLGVGQPDFGVLLDDMACSPDVPIGHARLLQPRIEAEIAFVLARDLDKAGEITVGTVRAAAGYAVPSLEIVDSRIAGWDISIVDTIADNGSAGLFVLGGPRVGLGELDPVAVTMTMTRTATDAPGGVVVSRGSGADCLGDPLAAVAWLAMTARDYGTPLRAGDVILSGALGPMVPVGPGDSFRAELSGLGSVQATFTPGPRESP